MCRSQEHLGGGIDCFVISKEGQSEGPLSLGQRV